MWMVHLDYSNNIRIEMLLQFNNSINRRRPGISKASVHTCICVFVVCTANCSLAVWQHQAAVFFVYETNSVPDISSQYLWMSRYNPNSIHTVLVTLNPIPNSSVVQWIKKRCSRLPKPGVWGPKTLVLLSNPFTWNGFGADEEFWGRTNGGVVGEMGFCIQSLCSKL